MTTASYAPPVNAAHRRRLLAAQRAVERAVQTEDAARAARNAVFLDLYDLGYGPTAMAAALSEQPRTWRAVHSKTPQRAIDDLRRARGDDIRSGGDGRRRNPLPEHLAARLRKAHRKLHLAGKAVEQALAARTLVFVELREQGVSAVAQAAELGVTRGTVQDPITEHRRAQGMPRNDRRRA